MPGFFVEQYYIMNKQDKDGILSAILDVPTPLKKVKLTPKNQLERLLIFLCIKKPIYEMVYLKGFKLSTNFRLTAISNSLILESKHEGNEDKLMDLMHENIYQMAAYVATAIHNQNTETPLYLIETIADQFSNEELKATCEEVYRRLDVQSFFACTALVRNLSLM